MPSLFNVVVIAALIGNFVGLGYLALRFRSFRKESDRWQQSETNKSRLSIASDRLPFQIESLQDENRTLSHRMRQLEALYARRFDRHDQLESRAVAESRREVAAEVRAPQAQAHDIRASQSADMAIAFAQTLTQAYNSLVKDFQQQRSDEFGERFSPQTYAFEGGVFAERSEGPFWVVAAPELAGTQLVLPNSRVAKNWEKFYRSMQGMQAKSDLGEVFEIAEGGHLILEEPATADVYNGAITLRSKGRISGI